MFYSNDNGNSTDPNIFFHWQKHLDYQDLVGLAHLGDLKRGQFSFVIHIWHSVLLCTSLYNFHPTTLLIMNFWSQRDRTNFEERTYCSVISFWFRFFSREGRNDIFYFLRKQRLDFLPTHAEFRYLLTSIIFWMTFDALSFCSLLLLLLPVYFCFTHSHGSQRSFRLCSFLIRFKNSCLQYS